jgi:NADH-quinone oxidoreductase subunit F
MLARFDEGMGTARDIDLINDVAKNMLGRTFCPLGDAAAMPTISFIEKFRDDFERKLRVVPGSFEDTSRLVQVQ